MDGMGQAYLPRGEELLVTADAGGSNGHRVRLWKVSVQRSPVELGLRITVCHFPPGTSKWNKIEHRMFCHITQNWRGPLVSQAVVVNLIANTTTAKGLKVKAELDTSSYPCGTKVSKAEVERLRLQHAKTLGDWNYTIRPTRDRRNDQVISERPLSHACATGIDLSSIGPLA